MIILNDCVFTEVAIYTFIAVIIIIIIIILNPLLQ